MSPRKNLPCWGQHGEGCPGLPSYEYQPYADMEPRRICGVHAEKVRQYYARSRRLRSLLDQALRPLDDVSPAGQRQEAAVQVETKAEAAPRERSSRAGRARRVEAASVS